MVLVKIEYYSIPRQAPSELLLTLGLGVAFSPTRLECPVRYLVNGCSRRVQKRRIVLSHHAEKTAAVSF